MMTMKTSELYKDQNYNAWTTFRIKNIPPGKLPGRGDFINIF